jgi:hypothetical protein
VLGLALCGGCGGDDDQLSRAEYAEKADAICRKYQERSEISIISTPEAFVAAADKTLEAFDDAMREFRALDPPDRDADLVARWLAQLDVLRSDVVKMRDRAKENDLTGLRELSALGLEHNRVANQLAEQLGMRVCSTG